jgi:hypothetical protein
MEKFKIEKDYITFGNIPIFSLKTSNDLPVNISYGYFSLEVSGSLKVSDQYKTSLLPDFKESINVKLNHVFIEQLDNNQTNYYKSSFNLQDAITTKTFIESNLSKIKDHLQNNHEQALDYYLQLNSTYLKLSFVTKKFGDGSSVPYVLMSFTDKYTQTIFSFYFRFNELVPYVTMLSYFINNYANFNNLFINKYYNQTMVYQFKDLIDRNISVIGNLNDMVDIFNKSLSNLRSSIDGLALKVNKLNFDVNTVISKTNDNDINENEIVIKGDNIPVKDELTIQENLEIEKNITGSKLDAYLGSNTDVGISEIKSLEDDLENFINNNADIIKDRLYNNIIDKEVVTNLDKTVGLEDEIDNSENIPTNEQESFVDDTLRIEKFNDITDFIAKINNISLNHDSYEKILEGIFSKINGYSTTNDNYILNKLLKEVDYDDYKQVSRMIYSILKLYIKIGSFNGYKAVRNVMIPFNLRNKEIKFNKESYDILSFIFIHIYLFRQIRDRLISVKNDITGNSDGRKLCSILEIPTVPILLSLMTSNTFDRDKFKNYAWALLNNLKQTGYFSNINEYFTIDNVDIFIVESKFDEMLNTVYKVVDMLKDSSYDFNVKWKIVLDGFNNYEMNISNYDKLKECILNDSDKQSYECINSFINNNDFVTYVSVETFVDSLSINSDTKEKIKNIFNGIISSYRDINDTDEFKEVINDTNIPEDVIKAIYVFDPSDNRLLYDYNYFLSKLITVPYDRIELIRLMTGQEQTKNINTQFDVNLNNLI